jgi:hypothetical protein
MAKRRKSRENAYLRGRVKVQYWYGDLLEESDLQVMWEMITRLRELGIQFDPDEVPFILSVIRQGIEKRRCR